MTIELTDYIVADFVTLQRDNAKLRKINAALLSRVERSMDHQFNAFTLFETAIALDGRVRQRTNELQAALHSLEGSHADLFRAKTEAENANSSKTTFLASLSHDLLQPLNAARLALSALSEQPMASAGNPLMDQIDRALLTLEDLIRTLLDISKLDAGVLRPQVQAFRISDVLDPLVQEFGHVADKRGLQWRLRGSQRAVVSDPLMLRRILQNLLANALRYTRRGGVLLGCRQRGAALVIQISDTGPGIPDERREAIFEEFRRYDTGAGPPGFGLGLSIVRRLAFALGHQVDLRSHVGRGSTFSVEVPLSDQPVVIATPTQARRAQPLPYGVNEALVLLIENEAAVSDAMEALLVPWGCDVLIARSEAEALALLAEKQCVPDLIIADLHLDNGALGYDAIDGVQIALQRRVPAFIITADHCPATLADIAARGLELVQKPVKPAELRSLMTYLLA